MIYNPHAGRLTIKERLSLTLRFFAVVACSGCAPQDFSTLKASDDVTYGYSANNPLRMKKRSFGESIGYSYDFLQGLVTVDDQNLKFIQRYTVDNPADNRSKAPLTNRYTGIPMSGRRGDLDKYVFVTSEEKDTVVIFVDVYRRGELKIPVGLKYK